jgi:hypothetical protein
VSQLCFEFVAAIFRLRKSLEFNISISQTKVCGYKNINSDTPSSQERGNGGEFSSLLFVTDDQFATKSK